MSKVATKEKKILIVCRKAALWIARASLLLQISTIMIDYNYNLLLQCLRIKTYTHSQYLYVQKKPVITEDKWQWFGFAYNNTVETIIGETVLQQNSTLT